MCGYTKNLIFLLDVRNPLINDLFYEGVFCRISGNLHVSISEEMNHGIITLKIPTEVMLPGLNALNAPSPAWQLPRNVMGRCVFVGVMS